LADTIVAFDHARRSLFLIANVLDGDEAAAQAKLDEIAARIRKPIPAITPQPVSAKEIVSNKTRAEFEEMVRKPGTYFGRRYFSGSPFPALYTPTHAEAFDIYRAVRRINPSPYMFFLISEL